MPVSLVHYSFCNLAFSSRNSALKIGKSLRQLCHLFSDIKVMSRPTAMVVLCCVNTQISRLSAMVANKSVKTRFFEPPLLPQMPHLRLTANGSSERSIAVQAICIPLGFLIFSVDILMAGDPTGCVKTRITTAKSYPL
jgi:hypothetical protein